jgi:hypothetical protein
MEQWRNAWAIPTQLCLFPILLTQRGDPVVDRLFMLLFCAYLTLDYVLGGQMDVPCSAHHAACLLGHAIVCLLLSDGFGTYFAGVVALEAGSGCMNVWLLDTGSRFRPAFYALGMTASNAAALWVLLEWADLPISVTRAYLRHAIAGSTLCLVITLVLVVLRQKACIENVRRGCAIEQMDSAVMKAQ